MTPTVKLAKLLLTSALAIVLATPCALAQAQTQTNDNAARQSNPLKAYRLTYTISELDGSKNVGTQHYSMVVVLGKHTSMKEGDKIPIETASNSNGAAGSNAADQTQFSYLDIGMEFHAALEEVADNFLLNSKVEQSSLGPSETISGVTEPTIRQTVLEGTSILTLGKPVMLGSIDVPNSTRRFDIDVVMDQVK